MMDTSTKTLTDVPPLRSIFDALPNPILVVDETNTICFANSAAEDFFQASSNVLARHRLEETMPFSSPVLEVVKQVRQSAGVMNEYSVGVGTPRMGGERIVDLQTALVNDDPRYVVLTFLRRSMAQKFDLQLTHRGAARSVSGMAAMLAHEIKNPLSGIRGAAQLLEPVLENNDRALAKLICEETDRIRDLVDQMEVFSDERPLERKPVNIHVVLDRVKQLTAAGMPNTLVIREEYDPSLPSVFGNQDQLVQVFLNLAKNAAESIATAGTAGEITFTTAFRPGVKLSMPGSNEKVSLPFEVCIHDNGPGISEDLRPHIFDAFVTTKPQGRGLGLALVAKTVRDHGGVVECISRERGTTFRVLLPMMRQQNDDPGIQKKVKIGER
jgi:two-component system, NtrC family, nitrogen regulation sensor histidine kinase GlnL